MVTTSLKQLTDADLVTSLASEVCPACGSPKFSRKTFCLSDYRRLPKAMRNAVYQKLGHGYFEAVMEAMQYLGREEFVLPDPRRPMQPQDKEVHHA
ncbi:MAG TPA: hypothetical protein VK797_23505 [Tepidisphaeraceae bacterium]|jgi:hypothetical protein|nr:hypothetical protein [Tepidisphaeraceae bacterium]